LRGFTTPEIRPVAENIYLIDDLLYSIPGLGAVYLLREDHTALVDTGPSTSAPAVLQAIDRMGLRPEQIEYLILTHIHTDHAGGVGLLAQSMPRAQVVVHHKALVHVADPARLIASSIAALGREVMRKNGDVLPVSGDRIIAIHDLDTLRLSPKQSLTFLDSPGHAPHALCVVESRNAGVFVGDCVGHYIEGTDVMVPITPPPAFDLKLYLNTLNRLKRGDFSRLYFPHSGVSLEPLDRLDAAIEKLGQRNSLVEEAAAAKHLDAAAESIVQHVCQELSYVREKFPRIYHYWASVDIPMSALEHVRYFRKIHGLS
jgi:glyoxylase-like metal-dependent hydrolase (beta-lactamase superfamily II)